MPNAHVAAAATGLPKSRRAFLSASVATIAVSATAAMATPAGSGSDTCLIRLGEEFDRLHALYLPARRQSTALHTEAHAPLYKRVRAGDRVSVDEMARAERESGFSDANEQTEALTLALDTLTESIRALPATTPQGFYVKVQAASFDCGFSHVFDGQTPAEMDHDIECFFHLLEDAKRFAGRPAT
jgi:hypothetical protein